MKSVHARELCAVLDSTWYVRKITLFSKIKGDKVTPNYSHSRAQSEQTDVEKDKQKL